MSASCVEEARQSQEVVVMRNLLFATQYLTVQVGQLSISDVLAEEFK